MNLHSGEMGTPLHNDGIRVGYSQFKSRSSRARWYPRMNKGVWMHSTPHGLKLSEHSRQTKSTDGTVHRVKRGDSLVKIAAQYRTTVKVLHELNPQIADLDTLPHKYMLYVQPQRQPPAPAPAPAPSPAFNPALWMAMGGLVLAAGTAFFLSPKEARHAEPKEPQLEERSGVLYKQTTASNKGGGRRILLNDGKRCGQAELLLNLAQERYDAGLLDMSLAPERYDAGLLDMSLAE
ncbi:hypothetical protein CYMTET_18768, partial [Cymbomonas tetramitiformis]